MNKTPPDLPFFVDFVPDVGFGNGWFASSDWPANKRERDVIFDPFLSPRNIICFGTQQAVFSVTRNILGNENSLPARGGGKLLRSRRFLPGPPWPEPKFSRRRIFETPSPENREDPAILAWKSGGLSPESDFNSSFSTDFRRLRMQNFGQISRIWTRF